MEIRIRQTAYKSSTIYLFLNTKINVYLMNTYTGFKVKLLIVIFVLNLQHCMVVITGCKYVLFKTIIYRFLPYLSLVNSSALQLKEFSFFLQAIKWFLFKHTHAFNNIIFDGGEKNWCIGSKSLLSLKYEFVS
jgi:hypothetical protein